MREWIVAENLIIVSSYFVDAEMIYLWNKEP